MRVITILLLLGVQLAAQTGPLGPWRAVLVSPGGPLPFLIEFGRDAEDGLTAIVRNGPERIAVPEATFDPETRRLVLSFPHYDSRIEALWRPARVTAGGVVRMKEHFEGKWVKTSGAGKTSELRFTATKGFQRRFLSMDEMTEDLPTRRGHASKRRRALPKVVPSLPVRWRVAFSRSEEPAVGIFRADEAGTVTGTFLTTTGDYRYLAGRWDGEDLKLSVFDGAHAFLFVARMQENGSLSGTFWSRDTWEEPFTAVPDPKVELPSALEQVRWIEGKTLGDLSARTLDGQAVRLDDERFAGKVRIVEIFGSWCPNCHDHARLMAKLHREYGPKGLEMVGIAFELTGDLDRDARQVRRFASKHGIDWPLLLGGTASKADATKALGVLDRLRSYPTTIFIDATGKPRAIWSGFSGPATESAGITLERRFRSIVERLLAES